MKKALKTLLKEHESIAHKLGAVYREFYYEKSDMTNDDYLEYVNNMANELLDIEEAIYKLARSCTNE